MTDAEKERDDIWRTGVSLTFETEVEFHLIVVKFWYLKQRNVLTTSLLPLVMLPCPCVIREFSS